MAVFLCIFFGNDMWCVHACVRARMLGRARVCEIVCAHTRDKHRRPPRVSQGLLWTHPGAVAPPLEGRPPAPGQGTGATFTRQPVRDMGGGVMGSTSSLKRAWLQHPKPNQKKKEGNNSNTHSRQRLQKFSHRVKGKNVEKMTHT